MYQVLYQIESSKIRKQILNPNVILDSSKKFKLFEESIKIFESEMDIILKVEEKKQYFDALNLADKTGDVSELEAILISNIYRTHAEIYTNSWKEKKRRQKGNSDLSS